MQKEYKPPQAYTDQPRPQIALAPVESSQVKAIGYDAGTRTLAVKFMHGEGAIYHYPDVAPETHQAFVAAESIGKFFGKQIKALPFTKYRSEDSPEPAATA